MKQLALYTILKYIEFGATALLTVLLASRVSAEEYGGAAIYFVTVTYLQFASLGANQVLVKWYANRKSDDDGAVSINLMFWSTLLVSLFIILMSAFSGSIIFLCAASVAALKLLYEAYVNIFRVIEKLQRINFLSFLFSFLFLAVTFFYAYSVQSYFIGWIVSLAVSTLFGFFLLPSKLLRASIFFKNIHLVPRFISDGIWMLLINFVTIALTTVDRSLLNIFQIPKDYIGSIQLVDTITNGITLSVTSVLFVLLPKFYSMIRSAQIDFNKLYFRALAAITFFFFSIILLYYLIHPWIDSYISKYPNFSWHFCLQLGAKSILILSTIPYAYLVVNSKEALYFRIFAIWVALLILFYFLGVLLVENKTQMTLYFNFILLIGSMLLNLNFYYRMKKMYK
jgi:hypothetical protein